MYHHPLPVQSTLCIFRALPLPEARFYRLLLPKPYRILQPNTVPGSLDTTVLLGWKRRKDINQDVTRKRTRSTPAHCVKESYIWLRGEVGYWEVLVEATEGREGSLRGGEPSNICKKLEGGLVSQGQSWRPLSGYSPPASCAPDRMHCEFFTPLSPCIVSLPVVQTQSHTSFSHLNLLLPPWTLRPVTKSSGWMVPR